MKGILTWKPVVWLRRTLAWFKPMNISLHGAYTGFFLVLSVFPILVVLFCLLGYTSLGSEEVMALAAGVLPDALEPLAEHIIQGAYENASAPVLSVSILTALWSAGQGMRGLLLGLNAVYGMKEDRSYFVTRGLSALYTFLFLVVLVLTLTLLVFGSLVLDYLRMTTNPFWLFVLDVIDLRFFLLLFSQTMLFAAMYAALPNRRNPIRRCLPGALLTSVGWLTFSNLFSAYVERFPSYANVFGSVYAAALAMLWLYFCVCIFFYGGALNRYLMER
ncbi:MAG: YihY/virulence factor BrkB family protein [Oscillospiraceae bacterium]|nr:YihY/virulence factor BrkB family protein [Oscillospiraceae bacterium]